MSLADTLLKEFDMATATFRRVLATASGDALGSYVDVEIQGRDDVLAVAAGGAPDIGDEPHPPSPGQLTVYLRQLDVPLPDLYGPTADTRSS